MTSSDIKSHGIFWSRGNVGIITLYVDDPLTTSADKMRMVMAVVVIMSGAINAGDFKNFT